MTSTIVIFQSVMIRRVAVHDLIHLMTWNWIWVVLTSQLALLATECEMNLNHCTWEWPIILGWEQHFNIVLAKSILRFINRCLIESKVCTTHMSRGMYLMMAVQACMAKWLQSDNKVWAIEKWIKKAWQIIKTRNARQVFQKEMRQVVCNLLKMKKTLHNTSDIQMILNSSQWVDSKLKALFPDLIKKQIYMVYRVAHSCRTTTIQLKPVLMIQSSTTLLIIK